jgi:hypothetical protein
MTGEGDVSYMFSRANTRWFEQHHNLHTASCLYLYLASSQSRDDKVLSVGALAEECNRTLQRIAQWKYHLCGLSQFTVEVRQCHGSRVSCRELCLIPEFTVRTSIKHHLSSGLSTAGGCKGQRVCSDTVSLHLQ